MTEYIIKVDEDKKDIMGNCPLVEKPQELVRCKDCVKKGNSYLCKLDRVLEEYGGYRTEAYDDWFCADGERRDKNGQEFFTSEG